MKDLGRRGSGGGNSPEGPNRPRELKRPLVKGHAQEALELRADGQVEADRVARSVQRQDLALQAGGWHSGVEDLRKLRTSGPRGQAAQTQLSFFNSHFSPKNPAAGMAPG